jgi:hypothetical protein
VLEEAEQLTVLKDYEIIAWLEDKRCKYYLYQINNFYVEVKTVNGKYHLGIKTFATTTLLKPYLEQIDITGIIKTDKT